MDLITRRYNTIENISGPIVFAKGLKSAIVGEMCRVTLSSGEVRSGQILELSGEMAVIQVLEGTHGIDVVSASIEPSGEPASAGLSEEILGRTFNGMGMPMDDLPEIIPEKYADINGLPINPAARDKPNQFIQTGISAIDGLNTLVRGQKLPIFSGAGLPANELAMQVVRQSKVATGEEFCVVFGAMGITSRDAFFFRESLESAGSMERTVAYINLASDPIIEKLFTPRIALTAAEYLAFEKGYQVMVVLTDMTSYCDALRVIGSARDEIPGRRSYPGYMYTDLASIYERAGRIKGGPGSVTIMPIITMPEDDITHPIPDLTGYITEGQIVLGRGVHRKSVYPPIDVLPSLSRLMNNGIGEDKTQKGHKELSDQLYASYAKGSDVRRMVAIVGEEGLSELDAKYMKFAESFEADFIGQGDVERSIKETLDLGLKLLQILPKSELTRLHN